MTYCYRPMDTRHIFWTPIGRLLDRSRPEYAAQVFSGNLWLFTTGRTRKELPEPAFATHLLADLNLQDSGTRGIPLYLSDETQASTDPTHWRENLSVKAEQYLHEVQATAKNLFFHSLAVTQSLGYLTENSGGLRQDWPRIPLPASRDALLASAALGREVAALLDTETPVSGVTSGAIRAELKTIAVISRVGGGALTPAEFSLTARLGQRRPGQHHHAGQRKNRVSRYSGRRTTCRLGQRAHARRVPERHGLLEKRGPAGVGLHHRRLPGDEKVAELERLRRSPGRRRLRRKGSSRVSQAPC